MGEDTPEVSEDGGGDEEALEQDGFKWERIVPGRRPAEEEPVTGDDAEPVEHTDESAPRLARSESGTDRVWRRFGADEPVSTKDESQDEEPAVPDPGVSDNIGEADGAEDEQFRRLWDGFDDGEGPGRDEPATGPDESAASQASGTVDEHVLDADDDAEENPPPSRFDDLIGEEESADREGSTSRGRMSGTDLASVFDDLDEFDRATSGSQVLVVSPSEHKITDEVCSHYLTSANHSSRNILFITTAQEPEDRLHICHESENWTGGRVGVIEVGDLMGDSTAPDRFDSIDGNPVTYKRVNSVKNFSKLGLLTSQILEDWSETDQPSAMCFHTLSTINDYVERETLFRFLYTLKTKLSSLGVTAHYHMDAGSHDAKEIATFKQIFDLVIDVDQDGRIELD